MKLNKKLSLAFGLVLISFSVLLILSSSLFIENYYKQQKKSTTLSSFNEGADFIHSAIEDDDLSFDDIIGLNNISQRTNTILYLFDADGKNLTNMNHGGPMDGEKREGEFFVTSLLNLEITINKKTYTTIDDFNDNLTEEPTYAEFKSSTKQMMNNHNGSNIAYIGKIKDDSSNLKGYLLSFTSYTTMRENTSIFNVFTIYITIILFMIAMIVSWFISSRLTKPIKEAELKTRKIANLDFSTKLEINSNDEIGQLSISINKMSDQLEESINNLKKANLQLEEDIKLKERVSKLREEFISDVSHELKTPIAIIQGYSEALKLEGLDQENINEYADIIIDESKRMNKLVKDLLKFSQIESGFLQLDHEEFSILDMINDVLVPNKLRLDEKKVTLKVDVDDEIVVGDYDMMQTVFNNFFGNAINHVEGENIISVTGKKEGNKFRVSVRNTGKQISEENQQRIWDSFYKIDKSRSRQYGGSGLGLSIVKSTMTTYGNKYGVFNNEDGVTFFFELDLPTTNGD